MSFLSKFRKPAWESRDAAQRARAVATDDAPELRAQLPDFARNDPDAGVRRAAVQRIADLSLLGDRATHDADAKVRETAAARLREALVDPKHGVTLAERERFVGVQDDADLLSHVATAAPESSLRAIALRRISRPGFLAERCLKDPDPELRLALLDRMDIAALERIGERARTSDKKLSRAARDRAEELRRAAGDPAALAARAQAIGQEFDRLRRERPAGLDAALVALDAEWGALRDRVAADLALRVSGYRAALADALAPPAPRVEPAPPIAVETPPPPTPAPAPAPREEKPAPSPKPKAPEPDPVVEAKRAALYDAIHALEEAIAAERLGAARIARAQVEALRAADPSLVDRKHAGRIAAAQAAIERMSKWQHWSNNKVRARLCEDAEQLIGSGMHPDGLATKIKELRAEWERLDESERDPAQKEPARETGLAKRFRAVCARALAPARPYFEKRAELRAQKTETFQQLLAGIDGEAIAGADASALVPLRRRITDALRRLDEADPRARGELGKRLRAALGSIDARLGAARGAAETDKHKLVANLRRQLAQAALDEKLELARDAQARFKSLPRGSRERDAELAKELADLVDPVFAAANAERSAADAARAERDRELQAVLDDLAALAAGDADALRHADARVAQLSERWRDLTAREQPAEEPRAARRDRDERGPPRERRPRAHPREREFDALRAKVDAARAGALARSARARCDALLEFADACAALESGVADDDARARGEAFASAPDAHAGLAARWRAALEGAAAPSEEAERDAQALVVRAELVAGIESPEDSRALRREIQMRRLADRLGGAQRERADELAEILESWLVLGPIRAPLHEELGARLKKALG